MANTTHFLGLRAEPVKAFCTSLETPAAHRAGWHGGSARKVSASGEKRNQQIAYEGGERQQAESVMYADLCHAGEASRNPLGGEERFVSIDIAPSALRT